MDHHNSGGGGGGGGGDREEFNNSVADEETIAREKKRSRRVSFAELTSVHVFDRDDESDDTPVDYTKPSPQNTKSESREVLGFFKDFGDSDDSKELNREEEDGVEEDEDENEDDEEEFDAERGFFVRNMDSSSPGSGFGSATSNEDDFFGPVSASFIKSGRLTDSAASDNHDITLDSTAFSMHFRSLVQSQSDGNFKTPTRTQLTFDGKSPTGNSTPNNSGSFMVLTGDDKPVPRPSISGGKSSGAGGSNDDMSLIEDNPRKYDYGELSPTLDALLAEGSKTLHDVSISNQVNVSSSSNPLNDNSIFNTFDDTESVLKQLRDSGNAELENIESRDRPIGMVSDVNKLSLGNGGSSTSLIDQISHARSSSSAETLPADALGHQNEALNESIMGVPSGMDNDYANDVLKVGAASKLEVGSGNDPILTPTSEKTRMDVIITQSDSEYLGHAEERMKDDPLTGAVYTPNIGFKTNLSNGSPSEGSISSLRVKRREILLDSSVLPSSALMTTPSVNQPHSSLYNESISHNASILSTDGNTSKLKIRRTSLLGAALEAGHNNSQSRLTNYFRNSPLLASIGIESNKDPNMKDINSVTGSVGNLLNFPEEKKEKIATTDVDTYLAGTPRAIRTLRQKEVIVATMHDKELTDQISAGGVCNDQNIELTAAVAPSPQFSTLTKDVQQHSSDNLNAVDALVIPEFESSQMIRVEPKGKSQEIDTPDKFNNSPLKHIAKKLSASPENSCISEALNQQKQYDKLMSSGVAQDSTNLRATISIMSNLSPMAEEPIMAASLNGNISRDTFLKQNNVHETSTFTGNDNGANRLEKSERLNNSGFLHHNLQRESEDTGDHETPLRYKTTLSSQFESAMRSFRSRTDPARLKEKVAVKTSSHDSASSYIRKRTLTPTRLEKRMSEWLPEGRIQKSPKVFHRMEGTVVPSELCNIKHNEAEKIGDHVSPLHWTDLFLNFSESIKGQLLPSADKLNSEEVCVLEDMLGRLQKANKYKILCDEFQSQKTHHDVVNLQQKRVAEARCLQQMLVYEQAKLQLLRLRHERLLKKVQLLQSGIQESQLLKLSSFSNICKPGAKGDQCRESHLPSSSLEHNCKGGKEAYDKVTSKRQELRVLDQKVKGLTESLLSSCKIKGEPNSTDTVVLVDDYLQKRTKCRFVRQVYQVWEMNDLESKDFHHNLVLNYCDILYQSFKVNAGPVSSISTTIKLIDANIMKSFPSISASTAFGFVFNADSTRNLGSPNYLALETQLTSYLFSNLLDVVEEAHMAHIELSNLIKTSFYSPSAEQLDLQLHFIDFKTGCKVILTLDMSALNRGVYPSEIIPSQLQTSGAQSPFTQLLSAEILAAVGGLKPGYSRIIRLCKCLSKVIKSQCM